MNISMTCHLHDEPYKQIKYGTKTIEMRLNDEKRKKLKVGDIVEFINNTTQESIYTKIINLHYFSSFAELYKHFAKESLGYKPNEEANPQDMEQYYSIEEQQKYGVVGIELEKV